MTCHRVGPPIVLLLVAPIFAQKAEPTAIVIDSTGKEVCLKKWEFIGGIRRLAWLTTSAKEATSAPLALEFRESNSTTYREGVLTLVPIERLRSLKYDATKQLVHLEVAGLAEPLVGSMRYREINQVVLAAEVDRGPMGVAEVTFRGGFQGGIGGLKIESAKPAAAPTPQGEVFTIWVEPTRGQSDHRQLVHGCRALYRFADGSEKLLSVLPFKKTFQLDLTQVKRLQKLPPTAKGQPPSYDILLQDGMEMILTPLDTLMHEGKPAKLLGLLTEVPAGYKLFPLHTIEALERGKVDTPPSRIDGRELAPLPKEAE